MATGPFFKLLIRPILVFGLSLLCYCHANAQRLPDEREVKLDFANVSIDSSLLLLIKASGVNISYDPSILPPEKSVSLSANYLKLGLALDNVFTGTDLIYKIVGDQLVIVRRDVPKVSELVTISGIVSDKATGEKLIYASVVSDDYKYTALTNEYGFYSITVPREQTYMISFSYLGYEKNEKTITAEGHVNLDITLEANNVLSEIVIISEAPRVLKQPEQFEQMPMDMLASLPGLLGETDVLRMAQMRSGITTQADGFGGLIVRGGSVDQNLVLLDGVPVYNTGHALGLYSIFNSSAINSAKLIKGGIPARYGGRLSSVFDVQTREGNNQKLGGEFSVSPLIAKGTIEGPLAKGKSSFLITGRRTIVDPWLKPFSKYQFERNEEEGEINFYFYDLNAKLNFDLGSKDRIYLSGYIGRDRYANNVVGSETNVLGRVIEELDNTDWIWGNEIGTLRWTHEFGRKLFGHANLSFTHFNFENFDFSRVRINPEEEDSSITYNAQLFVSDISDKIASYQLDWFASRNYFLKIGANYTSHTLTPGTADLRDTNSNILDSEDLLTRSRLRDSTRLENIVGDELRIYMENELRIGKKMILNVGGHFSRITSGRTDFINIQPRASAKFEISKALEIKLGYTQMDQFFHLLSRGGLGLPTDVWLPSTAKLAPEKSKQFSGGVTVFLSEGLNIKAGVFSKEFDNIVGSLNGAPFEINNTSQWENNVPVGTGESKGIEFELEKKTGGIKGWLSYTYSKSERTFPGINNDLPFRANGDREHMFHLNTLTRLSDNLNFGLSWSYGSPAPITLPTTQQPLIIDNELVWLPVFGNERNNVELPAYHKLDISLNLYNSFNWGEQKISIGAYNAYGRSNPFYVDLSQEDTGIRTEQVSLLPFLPYVNLSLSF